MRPDSQEPAVEATTDARSKAPRRNLAPLYAAGLVVLILLVLAMNFGGSPKPRNLQPAPPSSGSTPDLSGLLEEEAARRQRSLPPSRPPLQATPVPGTQPDELAEGPASPSPDSPAGPSPVGVYDPRWPAYLSEKRTPPLSPSQLPRLDSLAPVAAGSGVNRPALRYQTGVPTPAARDLPSDPAAAALASLVAGLPTLSQPPQPADPSNNRGADTPSSRYATFLVDAGQDHPDTLELRLDPQSVRIPFLLLQGTQIPAVLETSINSELPGQASGYVRKDVYDTLTGRYLLIPQGSRLIGSYNSDVIWGASRLLLVWNRLILPDGTSYQIVAPSSDLEGTAGLPGRVNNHWLKTVGSALMLSAISAGVEISQNPTATTLGRAPTASETAGAAVGQELGQVSANVIRRNLDIPPNIALRAGLAYNVVLTRDVVFPHPYVRRAR